VLTSPEPELDDAQMAALKPWAWLYVTSMVLMMISVIVVVMVVILGDASHRIAGIWLGTTMLFWSAVKIFCIWKMKRIRHEPLTFFQGSSFLLQLGFFSVVLYLLAK
jgi:uncharacterized membrane protein YqjE